MASQFLFAGAIKTTTTKIDYVTQKGIYIGRVLINLVAVYQLDRYFFSLSQRIARYMVSRVYEGKNI